MINLGSSLINKLKFSIEKYGNILLTNLKYSINYLKMYS